VAQVAVLHRILMSKEAEDLILEEPHKAEQLKAELFTVTLVVPQLQRLKINTLEGQVAVVLMELEQPAKVQVNQMVVMAVLLFLHFQLGLLQQAQV
jgi:hypothetical protein